MNVRKGTSLLILSGLFWSLPAGAQSVATRAEALPSVVPQNCDFSNSLTRDRDETLTEFWPYLDGPWAQDMRVTCANPADCPTYNAELAQHCTRVQNLGGDCSIYPLTLAQLASWPVSIDHGAYEVSYSRFNVEEIPYNPNGQVAYTAVQTGENCQPGSCVKTFDNSTGWPGDVTPQQLACARASSYETIHRFNGCLATGMQVKLETGEYIAVEKIRQGDRVWNPILKAGIAVRGVTAGPENIPVLELTLAGKKLLVTESHPLILADGQVAQQTEPGLVKVALNGSAVSQPDDSHFIKAKDLKIGDKLVLEDGSSAAIETIRPVMLEGKRMVYNFVLEGDSPESHYLVAEGIVTGDLTIQNKLARKTQKDI